MIIRQVSLSEVDKQIIASYAKFCDGLSNYLGKNYEIVLHSLEDFDRSAIKVLNGFHTNRTVGAPITDLALRMLSKIQDGPEPMDFITYFTQNKFGEPMKSSTIVIRGENDRIIGLLCINFYLNAPFLDVMNDFCKQEPAADAVPKLKNELFTEDSNELINISVENTRKEILANAGIPPKWKNREIIRSLNDSGIFMLKDSVVNVAKALNIDKNTVYMHLRKLKNGN